MWQRAQIQLQLPMCHLFKNPTMPLGRKILLMLSTKAEQGWKKNTSSQGAQMPTTVSATWCTTLVCRHQKKKDEQKKTVWELRVYMCFELCLKHNWKAIDLHRPQNYFYNNNKCTLSVGYSKWHNHGLHRGGMLCLLAQAGVGGIFFPHLSWLTGKALGSQSQEPGWGSFVGEQDWS